MRLMKGIILFLSCFVAVNATGQVILKDKKTAATNQLVASVYNGVMFNTLNVKNAGYPNPLSVPDNLTYSKRIAIDYKRVTSHRLILGIGLELGKQEQNFDLNYPTFDYVDIYPDLRELSDSAKFRHTTGYFGLRLTIGYSFPILRASKNEYALQATFTLGKSFFSKGGEVSRQLIGDLFIRDTIFVNIYKMYSLFGLYGDEGMSWGGRLYTEYNVGIARKTNSKIIGDIYAGVYAFCFASAYSKAAAANNVEVVNGHYYDGKFKYLDMDYYTNIDFTLGLKLSIGLKL